MGTGGAVNSLANLPLEYLAALAVWANERELPFGLR